MVRGLRPGLVAGALLALASAPSAAHAQDPPPEPLLEPIEESEPSEALPIEFHGFVSQGFIKSFGHDYLADSRRGSFEMSEVGLNATKVLTDQLRLGVQLFARDLGPIGNYTAQLDWYYLEYQFADWLGIRAGRTKLPFGLYNESSDVDAARVPVLLPQSIYPLRSRNYLLAQTGLELYGYILLGPAGGLEYRLYGGTIFIEPVSQTYRIDRSVLRVVGGRLLWETPLPGLRAGGSLQAIDLAYTFSSPGLAGVPGATPAGQATAKLGVQLRLASIEYAGERLLLAAEYSRWYIDIESSVPTVIRPSHQISERFYAMGAYRLTNWLTLGAYYGALYNSLAEPDGRPVLRRTVKGAYQLDSAGTLRFDLNAHWLFKLEGHYMRGTADLTAADRITLPVSQQKSWAVFFAKTTVYF